MLALEMKRIDPQGRVHIPSDWRREVLGDSEEVIVMRFEDHIRILPLTKRSLTEFFDRVEVDVSPEVFKDYHRLRNSLMGESLEVR
jgi:DNA-binding transcriptional regulator/RsmH inhibitor MraZ